MIIDILILDISLTYPLKDENYLETKLIRLGSTEISFISLLIFFTGQ